MNCRRISCGVLGICALIITGCGAARPSKYYQLSVPGDTSSPAADPSMVPINLLVGSLTASHLYREDHIVYSTGGEGMGTYEYQRWAEPPAEMIQDVLVRELRGSGKFRSVTMLRSNSRGDYVLGGHLYDFREVEANPMVARVAIEYGLRELKTGTMVWSHYYTHDEPVNGKDISAMVAALDRNVQGIIGQVRQGLEQYFSAHPPAPEPSAQQ
jgi:ABC-type uncharacterized transport system auxiliary subunit